MSGSYTGSYSSQYQSVQSQGKAWDTQSPASGLTEQTKTRLDGGVVSSTLAWGYGHDPSGHTSSGAFGPTYSSGFYSGSSGSGMYYTK